MALIDSSPPWLNPQPLLALPRTAFYLVRLTTYDHQALFGTVVDGQLCLSDLGRVAADEWHRASKGVRGIELDCWEISAHQIQGIVAVRELPGSQGYGMGDSGKGSVKPRSLSAFIAAYKAAVAKRINLLRDCPGSPVWQRSYQEQKLTDINTLQRVRSMLGQPSPQ